MKDTFRFGHCELHPVRRRLTVSGKSAEVGQRAFDVLLALVERAGDLVTKDELLARAWPNLVVEENNLSQQILALRRLIGAHAIATVPSLGYRLTIPLSGGGSDGAVPSIAVFPFEDLSAEHDQEFFADGVAEEILNALARLRGLRVVSRTSAFSFKGRPRDLTVIAEKLGVDWVLEGTVRKVGARVRVVAQLVRVATDAQAWSATYDRSPDDIFAVQDEIARAVVKEIRPSLLGPEDEGAVGSAPGPMRDIEAHRLYLHGRFFTEKSTRADLATGTGYLRQAVDRDPSHALAWAALARAYAFGDDYESAREAAQSALSADPELAEGHSALAWVRFARDWDWNGAAESNRRALELGPGNAEIVREAAYQSADIGGGLELARRAAVLDPISLRALRTLSLRCSYAGLLEEAERSIRDALALHPASSRTSYHLGRVRLMQGRFEDSLGAFDAEPDEMGRMWGRPLALHALGRTGESLEALKSLIDKHSRSSAFQIAEVYAFLEDFDQAFAWLDRAVQQRDEGLAALRLDPILGGLRTDARWQPLLGRVGLGA